ncbi:MAG: DeoR family transcriptional regulator [bacterium]|nr:DeoR family transcriptional regulator [bacterium]
MAEEPQEPQPIDNAQGKTAQVPVSEPITPAPIEPFDPAHDKPLPQAEAQAPSEATPEPTPSEPLQTAQINPAEVEKAAQAASEPVPTPQPQASTPPAPTTPSTKPNSPSSAEATEGRRELLAKGRAKVQEKKQKKLDKIMELLNTKDKVSNADVEKLFRVSDATATRYLSALQKQGKIRKVGKTGRSVFYAKM